VSCGPSCAGPNLWTDLTSVSTGRTNRGFIRKPARLALRGVGWKVPQRWKDRGFQYGVDELVQAIERAAGRVRATDRRALLGVADLSKRRGGSSVWHRSHQSGRDVDVLFYTIDERGRPLPPPEHDMIRFDAKGEPFLDPRAKVGYTEIGWEKRRFDAKRNWQFVGALLTDPSIRVQWIFVSEALEARMLAYRSEERPVGNGCTAVGDV